MKAKQNRNRGGKIMKAIKRRHLQQRWRHLCCLLPVREIPKRAETKNKGNKNYETGPYVGADGKI